MERKVIYTVFILLIQGFEPLQALTLTPTPTPTPTAAAEDVDTVGMIRRAVEKARAARDRVQRIGEVALGFAGSYYEDHVKPLTDPYVEWASAASSFLWEGLQNSTRFQKLNY